MSDNWGYVAAAYAVAVVGWAATGGDWSAKNASSRCCSWLDGTTARVGAGNLLKQATYVTSRAWPSLP